MLVFQPYLPHVITNSMQPLHDLNNSKIIFQKAQFSYQHVILKSQLLVQRFQTLLNDMVYNKTSGKLTRPICCSHDVLNSDHIHRCFSCSSNSGRMSLKLWHINSCFLQAWLNPFSSCATSNWTMFANEVPKQKILLKVDTKGWNLLLIYPSFLNINNTWSIFQSGIIFKSRRPLNDGSFQHSC